MTNRRPDDTLMCPTCGEDVQVWVYHHEIDDVVQSCECVISDDDLITQLEELHAERIAANAGD